MQTIKPNFVPHYSYIADILNTGLIRDYVSLPEANHMISQLDNMKSFSSASQIVHRYRKVSV